MVDFDQNFYVNIDFVLNTQIENIGQNQPQIFLFFFFREILQTVVETNMNSYGKKKLHLCPEDWFCQLISKVQIDFESSRLGKDQN